MVRVGILTCANMTNELNCSSYFCLEDSSTSKGKFARYAEKGGAQVVGIISCSGCPTLKAPEKIVRRVKTLAASGVDAIHFSFCVENNCPFKNKYLNVLQSEYPDIEFVRGTHEVQDEQQVAEVDQFVKQALCHQTPSMAVLIEMKRCNGE